MNSKTKKRVLAVYRDYLSYNRGTPLRVKSILTEVAKDQDIEIYTASRDESLPFGVKHLKLSTKNINNIFSLRKLIVRHKIDLVIFHTVSAGYYVPFITLLCPGVQRVLEMHGFSEEEWRLCSDQSLYKYYRNKLFYNSIYLLSNLITVCSETAREKLLKYNQNTYTVYGGVNLTKFNTSFLTDFKDEKSKRDCIVIGYSGNARIWQGLDFLLKSFEILIQKDPSFRLHLLLSEKIPMSSSSNIILFDAVDHDSVAKFNAKCDILVIPRPKNLVNTLSFPSKLMEYLAMGIPVVASRTSDMYRIIENEENGLLFDPDDTQGLIDCLLRLKDQKLREMIGLNGAITAKKYSWSSQGRLFTDLLKDKLLYK